ncbi:MAG TPA: TolC family protein [Bryobacteraceae bacterium]|nr:TolC family protein [Bryobacteraceae bacterium]
MRPTKIAIAVVCCLQLSIPSNVSAADSPATTPPAAPSSGFLSGITGPYRTKTVAPVNVKDSRRLGALMQAGSIYLSLQDAIALALENNLDLEVERYDSQIADANLLRAQAGGNAPGAQVGVTSGPGSVTGGAPSAGLQGYIVEPITGSGFAVPSLDPALVGTADWAHQTTPQVSNFTTGTASLIQRLDTSSVSVQKYFTTGTLVNLGLNNTNLLSNNSRAQFNPATNSNLALTVTQHLLQGFGPGVNNRQIRIAKNNREVTDLTFKAQVIATVSAIKDLYWDLVTYQENVTVQQNTLAANQRLYDENQKQVAVGTLAPIEVTRAQAEIAAAQQAVTVAQTQVLQQETILKNALSRSGVESAEIANAHIVPTDRIQVPNVEAISPIQDLTAMALSARPELAQFRILIQNQEIGIQGVRNELLPTLDAVASLGNNGLAGTPVPCSATPGVTCTPANGFFAGGYGTVLTQLFARNFPNYSAGFNLTIPIRNRSAQADWANSQLNLRLQQLGLVRLENQVRVEVQNAVIGVQQALAQYQSAVKQLSLQQETVDAEEKKLAVGASTTYNVILTQRDLVTAESNELVAESAYAKAKVEMDRATAQTLSNNSISIDEAFRGVVSKPPSPIPAVPPAPLAPAGVSPAPVSPTPASPPPATVAPAPAAPPAPPPAAAAPAVPPR